MNPGKKNPRTLLSLTMYGSQTQKHTEKKMTRFFSLKGTKSTPIFIKREIPFERSKNEMKKMSRKSGRNMCTYLYIPT